MKKQFLLLSLLLLYGLNLTAAVITVEPGENTIKAALSTASAGDILELKTGTYISSSNIDITKSITLRAASGKNALITISGGASFRLRASNINVVFENLKIDGGGRTASQRAIKPYGAAFGKCSNTSLSIKGCSFQNMDRAIEVYSTTSEMTLSVTGSLFQNINRGIQIASYLDSGDPFHSTTRSDYELSLLSVDNCRFYNMQRALNIAGAYRSIKKTRIKNTTFKDIGDTSNNAIYFAAIDGDSNSHPFDFEMDHCTLYNCPNTRSIYLPNLNGCLISNCIAALAEKNSSCRSFAIYGANSSLKNSISHNIDPYIRSGATSQNISAADPLFVDAANGNFQLYKNSPAVGTATDGRNLGDPHWGVSTENSNPALLPYVPIKKPYSMCPTTSSVRILWQMPDSEATGVVYYGETEALGQQVSSSGGWNVAGEGYVHVVEISGLKANTKYYYTVGDGKRTFEKIQSTQTAPNSGSAFRIFTISDTHENAKKIWENMQDFVVGLQPNLTVLNGDLINEGDQRPWNNAFFTPGEKLLSKVPMISAVGNHETGDPLTFRYSTYYDYFSHFSHGASEGDIIDPRGESYHSSIYGDAHIIAININNDPSSPKFTPGSKQYTWLEEQIKNSSSKWIFLFAHVGIYTTGSHGEWSAEQKKIAPLLEKYALKGKHIIVFAGDDHSFEHLYKSGVHYVRPGCGRDANYAQKTFLIDYQYSLYYNQISCFSTLDMAADGKTILLTARDSVGNEFYSYTFSNTNSVSPSLYITRPNGKEGDVTDSIMIEWSCFDPVGDAKISLYYSSTKDGKNGKPILQNLPSYGIKKYWWNVRNLYPKGDYYIYGILSNSQGTSTSFGKGKIHLVDDTTAPPAPTDLKGVVQDDKIIMTWKNPTHATEIEKLLQNFEHSTAGFVGSGSSGNATLSTGSGYNSKSSLKIDYNVTAPWGEGSAVYKYASLQDLRSTPKLSFWYKGDGSSRKLRLVIKQDANADGAEDDWWYNESLSLSSTEWKEASIDLNSFTAFSWHPNSTTQLELTKLSSIHFIVPSAEIASGTIYLDDIRLSGKIPPAADYAGTKILRRNDRYPANERDGSVVYNGKEESCSDNGFTTGQTLYYAAFAYDDKNNYSAAAQWKIVLIHNSLEETSGNRIKISYPGMSPDEIRYCGKIRSANAVNMAGKRIELPFSSETIHLSHLEKGFYFIEIHPFEGRQETFKIIKE